MSFLRFRVYLLVGYFGKDHPEPTGWTHIVLNYIGPNNGEGIKVFMDGKQVANDTTRYGGPRTAGDGRIVVGRRLTNEDKKYAGVQVDELIFFNAALSSDDVLSIYNSV